jgi:hypothetical protein
LTSQKQHFLKENTPMLKKIIQLSIVLLITASTLMAQRRLELGLSLGPTNYQGDLSSSNIQEMADNVGLSGALQGKYFFNDHWGVRSAFMYGRFNGDDSKSTNAERILRNLSFRNDIADLSVCGEVNLFPFNPKEKNNYTLFLFGGFSGYYSNPKAFYNNKWVALQPIGTEGQYLKKYPDITPYSRTGLSLVSGGGIKFAFNPQWHVIIEMSGYRAFSDYIDDVSGNTPSTYDFVEEGQVAAAELSYRRREIPGEPKISPTVYTRGNKSIVDWYVTGGITIAYNIYDPGSGNMFKKGYKGKCYQF